jgi:hypothetical protein
MTPGSRVGMAENGSGVEHSIRWNGQATFKFRRGFAVERMSGKRHERGVRSVGAAFFFPRH